MMATYRLGWRTPDATSRIRGMVDERLGLWATQWLASDVRGSLALETDVAAESIAAAGAILWFSIQRGRHGDVWLGVEAKKMHGVGQRILRIEGTPVPGLACDVARASLRALVETVYPEADVGVLEEESSGLPAVDALRDGVLRGRISGLATDVWLLADWVWCDRMAGPAVGVPRAAQLQPRTSLLGKQRVEVSATLDLGEMDLLETLGLKVGDVLVGDAPVDAAVKLLSQGRIVANGMLIDVGGRRSISIV